MNDELADAYRAAARDAEMPIARRRIGDRWYDRDEVPDPSDLEDQ